MKIGLYFGSFNPIHVGHLIIANHIAEFADVDQVWLVVTPHNPLKKKESLLDNYTRLELVRLACEDFPKLRPSDIEFKLEQPNYTVNTLSHLSDKFPEHKFSLIMGSDSLASLKKWKNFGFLVSNYQILVYPRIIGDIEIPKFLNSDIQIIDAPIVEISSTFVRECIKENKNVRALLPAKVFEYIDHNNIYKM